MVTDRIISAVAACILFLAVPAATPARAADENGSRQQDQEENEKEKTEDAEEVIITAPRIGGDETAASSTVEGDELRQSPRPSLLEAVSHQTPGMYVSSRGIGLHGIAEGASGGISIRGLGGSPNTQVLVVVDGVPDYQGIFGHPMPDAYVADLVEEVEVVPGGDSVLYGTNALGGVVAIESRWRTRPGHELHLRGGFGGYDSYLLQPVLLGHWGDWDLAAAFHGRGSRGHRAGAGGDLQVGQLAARVWTSGASRLALRGRVIHMRGADPGPASFPNPDHWFDVLRLNASALLEVFSDRADWRAMVFAAGGRHNLYSGFSSLDLLTGGHLECRLQAHRTVELLLGASADYVDGRVDDRAWGTTEPVAWTANLALYQQVRWRPLERLTLVGGLRQNLSSAYGPLLLYKAGVRYRPWRGGVLRARIAANFRQPTLRERYLPFPVANPDLEPERSRNLDAGIVQRLGRYLEIEATFFLTEAFDFIKYFGSWPTAEVVNLDHVVYPGVEGRIALRDLGPFDFSFGGAWMDVGRYTRQNPAAKVDGSLRLSWRGLRATLRGEWVTGLYQNNYGRDPIDDVLFFDLDLRYLFEDTGLELFAMVRNLLDQAYAYVTDYPMPGFHLFCGLEVHL